MAAATQCLFNPSGNWIAFRKGRHVFGIQRNWIEEQGG
jgi:hypothetical protein